MPNTNLRAMILTGLVFIVIFSVVFTLFFDAMPIDNSATESRAGDSSKAFARPTDIKQPEPLPAGK